MKILSVFPGYWTLFQDFQTCVDIVVDILCSIFSLICISNEEIIVKRPDQSWKLCQHPCPFSFTLWINESGQHTFASVPFRSELWIITTLPFLIALSCILLPCRNPLSFVIQQHFFFFSEHSELVLSESENCFFSSKDVKYLLCLLLLVMTLYC